MLISNRPLSSGRGDATRTRNTWFWRPLLYQLNYSPILPALASTDSIISKFAPLVNTKSGNFLRFLRCRTNFMEVARCAGTYASAPFITTVRNGTVRCLNLRNRRDYSQQRNPGLPVHCRDAYAIRSCYLKLYTRGDIPFALNSSTPQVAARPDAAPGLNSNTPPS